MKTSQSGLRRRKRKRKNKDPKVAVPARKGEDDAAHPSTLMVEPEDVADEATPVTASTEVPAEETKTPKKKKKHKKEDAKLEKFRLEQREVKAKRCPRSNTGSSSVNRISRPSGITESPFPVLYWKPSMGWIIAATCWKDSRRKTIT